MKPLEDIHILVVGDIMLDKYVMGEVERISPEAPVPIVHVYSEYSTLGGCGNVVRNIRELGVRVDCASSIGIDLEGELIESHLSKIGVSSLLVNKSKVTTIKERIIAGERKTQMIRIDREHNEEIDPDYLIENISYTKEKYDIIIISDYAKGVITNKLMKYLNSRDERIIVDPKPKNKKIYGFPFLITPNEKELKKMGGERELIFEGSKYVLETKGKRGMKLYDESESWEIPADEVDVYNVSGAGDTVISIMATCLSMGWNPLDSAYIANKCASYVVTKSGTSTVPKNKFINIMSNYKMGELTNGKTS